MKPEKKTFVVEVKKRRRLPRKEHSIWNRIDMKAANGQIRAEWVLGTKDSVSHESVTDNNLIADISMNRTGFAGGSNF
ncbi:hypothetical protein [Agrobacterium sp. NPDC089420]|uniref:hypothetical protein n=1 Tax=Agrobacterium sp. NPDC089420 TaxID=3363918 RepID=UPI00384B121C